MKPVEIFNMFNESEVRYLLQEIDKGKWELRNLSNSSVEKKFNPFFWYKDVIDTGAIDLFYKTITKHINQDIKVDRLYVNGQAHGQCGDWHRDRDLGDKNVFTLVYFHHIWQSEYGGHLLIKNSDKIISVLPEFNNAVLFDSTDLHVGLEPTSHCKTQRESIACKFTVLV